MPRGAPKGNTNAKKAERSKKPPRRLVVTFSLSGERLAWVEQELRTQGQVVNSQTVRRFVRRVGYGALNILMQQDSSGSTGVVK